jgi:MacB-like periplasmic core domain
VLSQDLRYNVRVIRRSGPLSVAVVLTLVVGLGMNSVVFSVFNGLLFRPSATRDPDTFVQIYARPSGQWDREWHGQQTLVALDDFYAIRSATRTLSAVTVSRWASFILGDGDGVPLRGKFVSCNFLAVHLGPVQLGRGLLEADCSAPAREPVVVLTKRAWDWHFSRDPPTLSDARSA